MTSAVTPQKRSVRPSRIVSGWPRLWSAPKARARRHEALAAYGFLLPDAVGLVVFLGLPMILAFAVSFFHASGFGGYQFIGLDNYRQLLDDPLLWQSAKVSLTYVVLFVPLAFAVSLFLALLVRDAFPGVGLARMTFFTPHVVSLVTVGLLWQFMLVEKRGPVSSLLRPFGLANVAWLGDTRFALPVLVLISVWFYMGYFMLILLSGLKDIPAEFYDAARVDGASSWQRFRYITWPLLRPTSFFVLVIATVNAAAGIQAFDLVYITTRGGPSNSTSTAVFYVYQQAFQYNDYGYAAAITAVIALVLMALTGVLFALTRGGRFDVD